MPQFTVKKWTSQPFAHVKRTAKIAEMAKVMAECFATLGAALAKAKAIPAGPPLAHYLEYDETNTTFEVGFPVNEDDVDPVREAGLSIGQTPAGEIMQGVHKGPYDSLRATYDAIIAQMKAQGLEPSHDMWERYMSPPETPPEEIETEVIWPIQPAA